MDDKFILNDSLYNCLLLEEQLHFLDKFKAILVHGTSTRLATNETRKINSSHKFCQKIFNLSKAVDLHTLLDQ